MREGYIERHLDPPMPEAEKSDSATEAFSKLPESIRRSLNPEVRYERSGNEKMELKNGWTLEYEYQAVEEEDGRRIPYGTGAYSSDITRSIARSDYRKLTNLAIKNEKGESIDLKEFPIDHIFFSVSGITNRPSFFQGGTIVSEASPNSVFGIMNIFHEGGHAILQQRLLSEQRSFKEVARTTFHNAIFRMPTIFHTLLPEKVVQAASEDVLHTERDAWVIALSKLRLSFEGLGVSREDVEETIHHSQLTLASHSEKIREMNPDF